MKDAITSRTTTRVQLTPHLMRQTGGYKKGGKEGGESTGEGEGNQIRKRGDTGWVGKSLLSWILRLIASNRFVGGGSSSNSTSTSTSTSTTSIISISKELLLTSSTILACMMGRSRMGSLLISSSKPVMEASIVGSFDRR